MNTDQKRPKPQSNRAKRLECAVFRRYASAWSKDGSDDQNESAGIQRTPNASRHGEAHKCMCFRTMVLSCLLFLYFIAYSASAATVLLTGATVHTVSGETFSPGQVLIKDGKIAAVGKTVSANGAETIDLAGKHLYPAMIALNTVLGLTEISAVRATQDTTEVG